MTEPKILIVDDEPFNVDYLEQELDELDYATVSASNGQEALEKISSESPDLVLLDIMMPVMDGFEVLTRLKADVNTRDIPVIVISANSDLKSVVRGIELGAEDYLPKPFEPALLKARISSSLEKKNLRDIEQLYLKSLERELEIGREIQQGFLPSELPKVDGWEIAAYFKAAREVAGDFYDAFLLSDGNLLCVIGDVCDKGVGAALFMTLFRSLIRVTATSDLSCNGKELAALTPAERLSHIIPFTNDYIADTHVDANMFATIFIGIFDLQNGALTYMNCGHEPPLWVKNEGAIIPLLRTGPAVGLIRHANFSVKEIAFERNDLLLTYTDGIPDAVNVDEAHFGKERLLEIVESCDVSPGMLLQEIEESLHQFIDAASQFDDITLLAIKRER
jgi:sigma-B regulation protein RsbU (phosphoserine phosphatase)